MFSNSNKVLAYLKQPSVYKLRRIISDQERKIILQNALVRNPKMAITRKSSQYRRSYDMILKQKQQQLSKYQHSILWSPRYTPWHFKYMFLIPATCVLALMLYIRYIANPKQMLRWKKKYGIKFRELQARGWLDSWLDEYRNPDQILTFQAYTLTDLQKLYQEGILNSDSKKVQSNVNKKKQKFIRGDKQFVLTDFKIA